MKNQFFLLSLIAISGMSIQNKSFAQTHNEQLCSSCNDCNRDACCCPPPCECYTPFACIPSGIDFFLNADFISWRANQENMEFAVSGVNGLKLPVLSKGKVFQPDFIHIVNEELVYPL